MKCKAGEGNDCGKETTIICYAKNGVVEFPICENHMKEVSDLQKKHGKDFWKFR